MSYEEAAFGSSRSRSNPTQSGDYRGSLSSGNDDNDDGWDFGRSYADTIANTYSSVGGPGSFQGNDGTYFSRATGAEAYGHSMNNNLGLPPLANKTGFFGGTRDSYAIRGNEVRPIQNDFRLSDGIGNAMFSKGFGAIGSAIGGGLGGMFGPVASLAGSLFGNLAAGEVYDRNRIDTMKLGGDMVAGTDDTLYSQSGFGASSVYSPQEWEAMNQPTVNHSGDDDSLQIGTEPVPAQSEPIPWWKLVQMGLIKL